MLSLFLPPPTPSTVSSNSVLSPRWKTRSEKNILAEKPEPGRKKIGESESDFGATAPGLNKSREKKFLALIFFPAKFFEAVALGDRIFVAKMWPNSDDQETELIFFWQTIFVLFWLLGTVANFKTVFGRQSQAEIRSERFYEWKNSGLLLNKPRAWLSPGCSSKVP